MRTHDQLDATLAKYFAWSFAPPWAAFDLEERLRVAAEAFEEAGGHAELSGPAFSSDDQDMQRAHDRARASCRTLALAVADAWALVDDDASVPATKRLLARADRLRLDIVGMDVQPAEAVRLLRLFVRHSARMTRRQRERAAAVATLVPLEHPEVAELVVEIARSGDRTIAAAILSDEEWVPPSIDAVKLVARLADVIDAGPSHAARVIAIEFLARLPSREAAIAALRRALRLPSFAVCARALHALVGIGAPAVTDADLVHVLRDLVTHPPPEVIEDEEHEDDERILADAVVAALSQVRPPDAEEALLDLIDAEHETVWLDAAWATEALAVAFPDTATAMVDHWLKCARGYERARALAALQRLPDEMAEPRLRIAAADPSYAVRDAARRQWLERFQRACPVRVQDLPAATLLDAPPTERFLSRLSVMHGRVREARLAMGRVLLAEAPAREALVLLLQLVADDADSGEPSFGSREEGWAAAIVERFGRLGVEGLCALAARFSEPESFGWMRRLGDLAERQAIAGDDAAPLRALAGRHVASGDAVRVDDAMRILARLGAPVELLDRILTLALDDDFGASEARTLVIAWPDRTVDARLASEMALALAERDWPRLRYASWIALERGAPAARVIAQRVLEVAEESPDAVDAAVECARHLRAARCLDDDWARAALSKPERPIFAVASRAWRGSAAVRPALESALSSRARGGASAVEAAIGLLHAQPRMSPRDRRLIAVLEGSAFAARAELVHALCVRGAPFAVVAPHLEELLVSADASVTGALVGVAVWLRSPKARARVRALLPRVLDFDLRADIEEALGTSQAPYWAEG